MTAAIQPAWLSDLKVAFAFQCHQLAGHSNVACKCNRKFYMYSCPPLPVCFPCKMPAALNSPARFHQWVQWPKAVKPSKKFKTEQKINFHSKLKRVAGPVIFAHQYITSNEHFGYAVFVTPSKVAVEKCRPLKAFHHCLKLPSFQRE